MKKYLLLEDGTIFEGKGFGFVDEPKGEIVFNTSMTGYQEIITDPSYYGQIVVLTYPLIGNYGVNDSYSESKRVQVRALIVKEICEKPSNWKSEDTLDEYLQQNKITGLYGIDTRALTRILRTKGTMGGIILNEKPMDKNIDKLMNDIKGIKVKKPVDYVTTDQAYEIKGDSHRIAVIDCGTKKHIIKNLEKRGCHVLVYPADIDAETILNNNISGVLVTNGPGDPKDNDKTIETIRVLIDRLPMFGICLGHQLIALAAGGDTEKMKYGHRGGNHPVKDKNTDRVYITTQNHGYHVIKDSLDKDLIRISHSNLNDDSVEGLEYRDRKVFGVQFHPEACAGPMDTEFLFDKFLNLL